eukprot:3603500-Rhodomonas_salina.3
MPNSASAATEGGKCSIHGGGGAAGGTVNSDQVCRGGAGCILRVLKSRPGQRDLCQGQARTRAFQPLPPLSLVLAVPVPERAITARGDANRKCVRVAQGKTAERWGAGAEHGMRRAGASVGSEEGGTQQHAQSTGHDGLGLWG